MAAGDVVDALPSRPPWMLDGLCREYAAVDFVPPETRSVAGRQSQADAVEICGRCLVKRECGAYALGRPELLGIWGATTSSERRAARAALDAATTVPRPRQKKRSTRRIEVADPWWTRTSA